MSRQIAETFWKDSDAYPKFGTIKQRRLHELNYLVPKLSGPRILDVGCGDGALLSCLMHLIDYEELYGLDFSAKLLMSAHPAIITKVFDCYNFKPDDLPMVNSTICAGVVPYIFEDSIVSTLLTSMRTEYLFLRAPCTLKQEGELINTYSTDLESNYSSFYRPVEHIVSLMEQEYAVQSVDRIYPDSIESKYGTKQYYIVGKKK